MAIAHSPRRRYARRSKPVLAHPAGSEHVEEPGQDGAVRSRHFPRLYGQLAHGSTAIRNLHSRIFFKNGTPATTLVQQQPKTELEQSSNPNWWSSATEQRRPCICFSAAGDQANPQYLEACSPRRPRRNIRARHRPTPMPPAAKTPSTPDGLRRRARESAASAASGSDRAACAEAGEGGGLGASGACAAPAGSLLLTAESCCFEEARPISGPSIETAPPRSTSFAVTPQPPQPPHAIRTCSPA
jgi:hypothetical protein